MIGRPRKLVTTDGTTLPKKTVLFLSMICVLLGCDNDTPNNPYPSSESRENIYYGAYAARPRFLDPARSYSNDESVFTGEIYEPVLQYRYLDDAYLLETQTATQMPVVSYYDADMNPLPADASYKSVAYSVYDIQIQSGILYAPSPAFAQDENGVYRYHAVDAQSLKGIEDIRDFKYTGTRELTSADYVYEIKRLADPQLNSPIYGVMADYIVGLKTLRETLAQAYQDMPKNEHGVKYLDLRNFPLAGVKVIDPYRYQITLKGKYPQFMYWLAMAFFAPMPWEADAFYAQKDLVDKNIVLDWFPVGTGPYMLTDNNPNRRMVMVKNPNYKRERMPHMDQIVYTLEKESIPRWNKFLQGYYDVSGLTSDSFNQAIEISHTQATLTPELRERNVELQTHVELTDMYWGFNMRDPVVGGYSARARKLRQAISIAIDMEEFIEIFSNGRGLVAQNILPPGIFGANPDAVNTYVYEKTEDGVQRRSIEYARLLLAEAGYPKGIDPKTGEPLIIHYDVTTRGEPGEQARFAWMRKQFDKLGIEVQIRATDYNRFRQKLEDGYAQFFVLGWIADYPDPENFFFLLYGQNGKAQTGGVNNTNYNSPAYDALFERMKAMDNGPERAKIIEAMINMLNKDAPWVWGYHPETFMLKHAWLTDVKQNEMLKNPMKYYQLDPIQREEARNRWNQPIVWPLAFFVLGIGLVLLPVWREMRRKEKDPPKNRMRD